MVDEILQRELFTRSELLRLRVGLQMLRRRRLGRIVVQLGGEETAPAQIESTPTPHPSTAPARYFSEPRQNKLLANGLPRGRAKSLSYFALTDCTAPLTQE